MESAESWRGLFENWPEIIPRKGSVNTKSGETIPFVNFMISDALLLIERDGPDASGARKFIITYDAIAALKLSATGELSHFQSMGFQPPL